MCSGDFESEIKEWEEKPCNRGAAGWQRSLMNESARTIAALREKLSRDGEWVLEAYIYSNWRLWAMTPTAGGREGEANGLGGECGISACSSNQPGPVNLSSQIHSSHMGGYALY